MSQRAFVYFIPPTFAGDNQATQKFSILVGTGNSGNTPTRELSYEMDCNLADAQGRFIFATEKTATSTIIGPKVVITPIACSLTIGDKGIIRDAIGESSTAVAVIGKATYRDIVQPTDEHETRFCYVVTGFEFSGLNLANLHVQSEPCGGQYNCADDECKKLDRIAARQHITHVP